VSTGVRFSTLPRTPSSAHTSLSPPTTLTLIYNPLIGYASTAYAAQISPTIALASRFGVNVYSYESDLSVGGEWWIGRRRGKRAVPKVDPQAVRESDEWRQPGLGAEIQGREAILEEGDLRGSHLAPVREMRHGREEIDGPFAKERVYPGSAARPAPPATVEVESSNTAEDDRDGILKAKVSGNWVRATRSASHRPYTLTRSLSQYCTRRGYGTASSRSGWSQTS
jgi:distribution and morphology protein 10